MGRVSGNSIGKCFGFILASLLLLPLEGSAQLTRNFSWNAPTTNADNSTPVDLNGYELVYGSASNQLNNVVNVGNVLSANLTFPASGTYFVAARAYDLAGNRSTNSNTISVTVQNPVTDADGDGVADASDCAPNDNTRWRTANFFADADADGIRTNSTSTSVCYGTNVPAGYTSNVNGPDNCASVSNANQLNTDGDSQGDACDSDDDNDTVADGSDCAPTVFSAWRNQAYNDSDRDGVRNSTSLTTVTCFGATAPLGFTLATNGPDNCPNVVNANQADSNGNGVGDACEVVLDADGDGVADASDCAPSDNTRWRTASFFGDADADGIRTSSASSSVCYGTNVPAGYTSNVNGPDNCPSVSNANQLNTDGDSQGDACDTDDDNDTVLDASDCAPTTASAWRNQAYNDSDRDGVRNTTGVTSVTCFGTTPPLGFTIATNGPDNCPNVANPNQADSNNNGVGDACETNSDTDGDGVTNAQDNCPTVSNANQLNTDGDNQGDACDSDDDNDTVDDGLDCAPLTFSAWRNQAFRDSDGDGVTDSTAVQTSACFGATVPQGFVLAANGTDNCATVSNANQLNTDGDSQGDACDGDDDNDQAADASDCAPTNASAWRSQAYRDTDGDGVTDSAVVETLACFGTTAPQGYLLAANGTDNCPNVANPNQADSNNNGVGDACEAIVPPKKIRHMCGGSDTELSFLPFIRRNVISLLRADATDAREVPVSRNSTPLGGHFSQAIEEITVAYVRRQGRSRDMEWALRDSGGAEPVKFGKTSEKALGCYADDDDLVDYAMSDTRQIRVRRSTTGAVSTYSFGRLSGIREVLCRDTNGDGIDEAVVLSSGPVRNRKATSRISVFSLTDGTRLSQVTLSGSLTKALVFDADADGTADLCAAGRLSSKQSQVVCAKGTDETIVKLPYFRDITTGTYVRYPDGSTGESIAFLGLDRKFYTVLLGSEAVKIQALSSKTVDSLLKCR